jgi:hydroxylamine reductase
VVNPEVNAFTVEALFSTLTNVDFDPARMQALINRCIDFRESLKQKVADAGGKLTSPILGHQIAAAL